MMIMVTTKVKTAATTQMMKRMKTDCEMRRWSKVTAFVDAFEVVTIGDWQQIE